MIRVTFLAHSGFLVEAESVSLLFDWWRGALPPIRPEVPLLVFASHCHQDHFDPKIFTLDDGARDVRFLLGQGITPQKNREKWKLSPETEKRCLIVKGNQRSNPLPDVLVETLPSTDEGAAFLVTLPDGKTIFHAGDLNWWHWEGEHKSWNNNMAANFRAYTEPLRGRSIDLAMLPLDPRQEEAGFWGMKYFLELADIRRCLPMHQWGKFSFTGAFLENYPEFTEKVVPVEKNGQVFTFDH